MAYLKTIKEFGPRLAGVTVVKPIVYGSVAHELHNKQSAETPHTHKWTVYVKPYINEDMSAYVEKVSFKLHDTCSKPRRVVTKPPFAVVETGWGEFDIEIKIHFHDRREKPVILRHWLKLNLTEAEKSQGKACKVSETLDELVFQDPSVGLLYRLNRQKEQISGTNAHVTDFADVEKKAIEAIKAARKKVRKEISDIAAHIRLKKLAIAKLKEEISKVEESNRTNTIYIRS